MVGHNATGPATDHGDSLWVGSCEAPIVKFANRTRASRHDGPHGFPALLALC